MLSSVFMPRIMRETEDVISRHPMHTDFLPHHQHAQSRPQQLSNDLLTTCLAVCGPAILRLTIVIAAKKLIILRHHPDGCSPPSWHLLMLGLASNTIGLRAGRQPPELQDWRMIITGLQG